MRDSPLYILLAPLEPFSVCNGRYDGHGLSTLYVLYLHAASSDKVSFDVPRRHFQGDSPLMR